MLRASPNGNPGYSSILHFKVLPVEWRDEKPAVLDEARTSGGGGETEWLALLKGLHSGEMQAAF